MWNTREGRVATLAVAVLALGVAVALIALWPPARPLDSGAPNAGEPVQAEVAKLTRARCNLSRRPCQRLELRIRSGPDRGDRAPMTLPGEDVAPTIAQGDRLRVVRNFDPQAGGAQPGAAQGEPYAFADFERRAPVYWAVGLFALFVIVLGRWQGVRSLVGLGLSLLVVTQFIVPAILDGSAPLLVALVGGLAVMIATLGLTHGLGVKSMAAVLGAVLSLLLTGLLAVLFVKLAHITGFSSEEAALLRATPGRETLSLEGLVLAGILVGALGVLDDVTVSQASTVLALRRADPAQGFRRLFGEALTVGRDHLGATVNTLVLAYVGAALPILLIFASQQTAFTSAINREVVAEEIIAMCVGSIGLVAAVPITTALAALLAVRMAPDALEEAGHGHVH
jgi:uncharacterized membrane protein